MKFLDKRYHCTSCDKDVYYLFFKKDKKESSCPICKKSVEFYWREIDTKYLVCIIIGISFFAFATIYTFWMMIRGGVFVIDIINISLDYILSCAFAVFGLQRRKKNSTYETSKKSSEYPFLYKKQNLYVFIITISGFIIAAIVNFGLYFIFHRSFF
ncbi:MAG: hypothetical protein ACTSX6_01960 [Candidatus Heimdallarchaeaceae archaeon]